LERRQCYNSQKYGHLGRKFCFPDRRKSNLGPQTTKSVNNIVYRENVENERYLPFPPLRRNPAKDTYTNLFSTTEIAGRKKFKSDNFYKMPNDNRVFLKTTLHQKNKKGNKDINTKGKFLVDPGSTISIIKREEMGGGEKGSRNSFSCGKARQLKKERGVYPRT
jgi:hypothetical protein